MKLHDLRPHEEQKKKRKRVGRGTGSGKGKTSGRGTKGQNSRSGGSGLRIHLERGRGSMIFHLPKLRGFNNRFKVYYTPVNLDALERLFDDNAVVTPETLFEAGLLRRAKDPVVILGRGELRKKLNVTAHRISESAKSKIEATGGSIEVLPSVVNRKMPRS